MLREEDENEMMSRNERGKDSERGRMEVCSLAWLQFFLSRRKGNKREREKREREREKRASSKQQVVRKVEMLPGYWVRS